MISALQLSLPRRQTVVLLRSFLLSFSDAAYARLFPPTYTFLPSDDACDLCVTLQNLPTLSDIRGLARSHV
jgi:hypothetical protein